MPEGGQGPFVPTGGGVDLGSVVEGVREVFEAIGGFYTRYITQMFTFFPSLTESVMNTSRQINELNNRFREFASTSFTTLQQKLTETAWSLNLVTTRFASLYERLRDLDSAGVLSVETIKNLGNTLSNVYPKGEQLAQAIDRVGSVIAKFPSLAPYVSTGRAIPEEEIRRLVSMYGAQMREPLMALMEYQRAAVLGAPTTYPGRAAAEARERIQTRFDIVTQRFGETVGRLSPFLGELVAAIPMLMGARGYRREIRRILGIGGISGAGRGVGVVGGVGGVGGGGVAALLQQVAGGLYMPSFVRPEWYPARRARLPVKMEAMRAFGEMYSGRPEWREAFPWYQRFTFMHPEAMNILAGLTRGGLFGGGVGIGVSAVAAGMGATPLTQALSGVFSGALTGFFTGAGPWGAVMGAIVGGIPGIFALINKKKADEERAREEEKQRNLKWMEDQLKRLEDINKSLFLLEQRIFPLQRNLDLIGTRLQYASALGYGPGVELGLMRQQAEYMRAIGAERMRTAQQMAREQGWTPELWKTYLEGYNQILGAQQKILEIEGKRVEYTKQLRDTTSGLLDFVEQEGYLKSQFPGLMQANLNLVDKEIEARKRLLSSYADQNSMQAINQKIEIARLEVIKKRLEFEAEVLQRIKDQQYVLGMQKEGYNTLLSMAQQIQAPWSIQMNLMKNITEVSKRNYELSKEAYQAALDHNRPIREQLELRNKMVQSAQEYVNSLLYARRTLFEQMAAGFMGGGGTAAGALPVLTPEGMWKGPAWYRGAILGTTEGRPTGITWQEMMEQMFGTIAEQTTLFENMVANSKTTVSLIKDGTNVSLDNLNAGVSNMDTALSDLSTSIPQGFQDVVQSIEHLSNNIESWLAEKPATGMGGPAVPPGSTAQLQLEKEREKQEKEQERQKRLEWLHKAQEEAAKGALPSTYTFWRRARTIQKKLEEKFGKPIEIPKEFQHGGIVERPTIAMMGETGAEAVIPLRNGRVPVEIINSSLKPPTVNVSVYIGNKKIEDYLYQAYTQP